MADIDSYQVYTPTVDDLLLGTDLTTGATKNFRIGDILAIISGASMTLDNVTTNGNVTTNAIAVGGIMSPYFRYDVTVAPALSEGVARWNPIDGVPETRLKGNNVTLQHGTEMVQRVVNKTGSGLNESEYKAVVAKEAQGQRLAIFLADKRHALALWDVYGLVTENISNNGEGFVTTKGLLRQVNTTGSIQGEAWSDGDELYLGINGNLTKVQATNSDYWVRVGRVVYAHANNGIIDVNIKTSFSMLNLNDVNKDMAPITAGSVMYWTGTFWDSYPYLNITVSGASARLKLQNLPTYASNAAAVSGGLATNTLYKTATGEVRIVV